MIQHLLQVIGLEHIIIDLVCGVFLLFFFFFFFFFNYYLVIYHCFVMASLGISDSYLLFTHLIPQFSNSRPITIL